MTISELSDAIAKLINEFNQTSGTCIEEVDLRYDTLKTLDKVYPDLKSVDFRTHRCVR